MSEEEGKKILAYVDARKRYDDAVKQFDALADKVSKAAEKLRKSRGAMLKNNTEEVFVAADLPIGTDVERALRDWYNAYQEQGRAWSAVPKADRSALAEPQGNPAPGGSQGG
jgi:hypothetical protein